MFSGDWGCQLPAVVHTWHCGVLDATAVQLLATQSNRHQNHLTDRNNELKTPCNEQEQALDVQCRPRPALFKEAAVQARFQNSITAPCC